MTLIKSRRSSESLRSLQLCVVASTLSIVHYREVHYSVFDKLDDNLPLFALGESGVPQAVNRGCTSPPLAFTSLVGVSHTHTNTLTHIHSSLIMARPCQR